MYIYMYTIVIKNLIKWKDKRQENIYYKMKNKCGKYIYMKKTISNKSTIILISACIIIFKIAVIVINTICFSSNLFDQFYWMKIWNIILLFDKIA